MSHFVRAVALGLPLFVTVLLMASPLLAVDGGGRAGGLDPRPSARELESRQATLEALDSFLGSIPPSVRDGVELRRRDREQDGRLWIRAAGTTVVRESMARVVDLITDYGRYRQVLKQQDGSPILAMSRVHAQTGARADVTLEVLVPWYVRAVGVPNSMYRLRMWAPEVPEGDRPWTLTWTYLSGNVGETIGGWHVEPLSPNRTRLTYYLEVDMGLDRFSMRSWFPSLYQKASAQMMETSLVGTVASMRREAEARHEQAARRP